MRARGWDLSTDFGFKGDVGQTLSNVAENVGGAVLHPVETLAGGVATILEDPTKANIGDAASAVFPIAGSITTSDIRHPLDIPAQAAIVLGAGAAGGSLLSAESGTAAAASAGESTSGALIPASTPYLAPGADEGIWAALEADAASTSAGADAALESEFGLAAGGGSEVGIGDSLLNGLGGLGSAIAKSAPVLFLLNALKGGAPGGAPGGSLSLGGLSLSQPGGSQPGSGGVNVFSGPGSSAGAAAPQLAGVSTPLLIVAAGIAISMIYLLVKRRK